MKNLEELKKVCNGVASIVTVTPFKDNEDVDYEGYKENLRFLLDKIKGKNFIITAIGSAGEFTSISEEEYKKLIELVVNEVSGACPVFIGTGQAGTRKTIELSKYAEKVGADGVQVILPYYFVPTEKGMYQHFKNLSESVDLGILIYNNPAFSKSWINPNLMSKLAECDNIIGVKENTPHLMLFDQMASTFRDKDFAVLCGNGEKWFPYLCVAGIAGIVSSFANFAPEITYKLLMAAQDKDYSEIQNLARFLEPWFSFVGKMAKQYGPDTGALPKPGGIIYGEGNIRFAVIKEAMNQMGLRGGRVRSPLMSLEENDKKELKDVLKNMNLL